MLGSLKYVIGSDRRSLSLSGGLVILLVIVISLAVSITLSYGGP